MPLRLEPSERPPFWVASSTMDLPAVPELAARATGIKTQSPISIWSHSA